MSTPVTHIVRPAGAGHETLYVGLLCLFILLAAAGVVSWHGVSHEAVAVPSHQLDARRDLSAAEQGIYADLRVTLDEVRLLAEEQPEPVTPAQLAREGFAPFAQDASSVSRGSHAWNMVQDSYVGLSQAPEVAGSFLLRVNGPDADVWINRAPSASAPSQMDDKTLADAGWQQVIAQFDTGVTRQHRH
ncbi:hypothetical protein IFT69_01410 [Pseudomonas putida]|nr:hypothetical protein [Pseudomonas putida]